MITIEQFIRCIIEYGKIQNFVIKTNYVDNINNMRLFHNYIKSNLIINACKITNATTLMDVACGRGGDLQKWLHNSLNLKYILAFDNHPDSIFSSLQKGGTFDGAISRFKSIKNRYKNLPFINFKVLSMLDPNILNKINSLDSNKIYDVISCQFALHYFCKNNDILNNVLYTISKKLKKGGLFIGTASDGDIINNILNKGNVNIPLLTLLKKSYNSYLFYIQTNLEKSKDKSKENDRKNYFEIQGVSSEFYLLKKKLIEIAKLNNLEVVEIKNFNEWYNHYKKYKGYNYLSTHELVISFLNFSFIFRKV